MALQIDDETDFNYLVPLSPTDGSLVFINGDSKMANLLFYQVRKQTGEHIDKIDVTGAILMSLEDLKNYRNAISENIEATEKREK
ncbi:MAG: hypothetical protein ACHQT9_03150 [Candidatus Saccharimonadales bacterium]